MQGRFIDSALIAGLVIVFTFILYVLFFSAPNAEPPLPPADTAPTEELSAAEAQTPNGADVIPLIPDEEAPAAESFEPEPDTANSSEAQDTAAGTDAAGTDAADTGNPETEDTDDANATSNATDETLDSADRVAAEATEAASDAGDNRAPQAALLPEGAFDLERVGFSFVTGGAGACGIVLEPWEHVAVSPDILERYPCGTVLTLELDDSVAGRSSAQVTVADTMPPTKVRTVNVYVGADEPALEYGVQSGRVEP